MANKRYHFIREPNRIIDESSIQQAIAELHVVGDKLTATYKSRIFEMATYIKNSEDVFLIDDCQGSLILVDKLRRGINKLHIGKLVIKNPHAEVYGSRKEGPRIDLNRIDVKYARERLEELKKWRGPNYREKLKESYDKLGWYSVPHRLNQLDISKASLELKIQNMEKLVQYLEARKDRTFVSDIAIEIEKKSNNLMDIIRKAPSQFPEGNNKRDRRFPKIIICSNIINRVEKINSLVKRVLDFAEHHENFRFDRARKYWENVDSWGECRIGEYLFTRYEADFFTHLKRHFPKGKTIGSTFNSYFPSPRAVIDFAWKEIQNRGYNGKTKIIQLDLSEPIGLEGVIALSDLPAGTEIKEEIRDEKHKVNVVSGIKKQPTNHLVIIMDSLETGRHGFTSIYPGQFCPDIDKNPDFWQKHAFMK